MRTRQEVLRVYFQPADKRTSGHQFSDVRKPQADSCTRWDLGTHSGHSQERMRYFAVLLPPTIRSQ